MPYQRGVDIEEGAGVHRQILNPHPGDLVHHEIQNEIPIAQVMVEGDGHPVPQPRQRDGLPEALYNLAHAVTSLEIPSACSMAMVR